MNRDAAQIPEKTPEAERNCAMDWTAFLDAGELIASVIVTEVGTNDLTLLAAAPTIAEKLILDDLVAIGKAAQWRVSGGTRGKTYRLKVAITTDATAPQTDFRYAALKVI